MTISECPGDFNDHLNQPACTVNDSNFTTIRWTTKTNPVGPPGFFCELEKNTTYFMNIVHSDNSENNNYETSGCQDSSCGVLASQNPVILGNMND